MAATAAIIAAAIGAATAIGGATYAGIKSSNENNKARKLLEQQKAENKKWYETKMSEDYTKRADVQAAINKQRELLDEQYKRAKATNVVAGGTEEALAIQKAQANKSLSNTMADVAAAGAAYKDNIEQQYRAKEAALDQQEVQTHQQQAQQAAQAGSQVVNAGTSLVGSSLAQIGQKGS